MSRGLTCLFLSLVITGAGASICLAQAQPPATPTTSAPAKKLQAPKPKKPTAPKPAEPQAADTPVVLPEPPTPVTQVQQIGLPQCTGVMNKMSRETLTRTYDVQSGWNREAPTQHVIQSVAVLNSPKNVPQDGLVALVATPTPNGACDGVALQVFPLAGDCDSVKKVLENGGSTARPILNTQIMFAPDGKRLFLLPGVGKTCIAVAVDSTFGEVKK
jgi:hypothetical protein